MVLFDITAGADPLAPGCGEPIMHIARDVGVTPGPARVIDSNGGVVFNMVMRPAGRTQVDLAKRYPHAFDTAIDIDSPGIWELKSASSVFCRTIILAHFGSPRCRGLSRKPKAAPPAKWWNGFSSHFSLRRHYPYQVQGVSPRDSQPRNPRSSPEN